ncbi:hypothetical protein DOTSEDRAFT_66840 [Dothistroma septosporum NZE10]|uniref:RING-type domain-containing protein n=1 Tax=Dothistroma septosporum (strain NZE10 / CBS 128990) TaxID=675120 RepID=M2XHE2_DOTSN|nr:hypothetical protein DOTSEDRAFT_66840 [Dothistroma septosporum NZE10]
MEDHRVPIWTPSLQHDSSVTASIRRFADVQAVRTLCDQVERQIRYYGALERFRHIKQTSSKQCIDGRRITTQKVLNHRPEASFCWVTSRLALHQGNGTLADCTICLTPADDRLTLSCDRVYCRGCFEGLCISNDVNTADLKTTCRDQDDQCRRCSSAVHIRRRLHHHRFCPTANGRHIISAGCFEQHDESLSCEEHRDLLKRATGVKDCPQCKTPLEKIDGCDHMTAVAPCHVHMDEAHGGSRLPNRDNDDQEDDGD